MKIRFADVKPNPYRDLKLNPLRPDKIEALRESIHETGYWDNVVVRKNASGEYEAAFGHHRIQAARLEGIEEGNFIVKNLSNDMMLAMMARENAEVYGNDLKSTVESVEALIRAYAEGALSQPEKLKPEEKTNALHIRYAPSYVPGRASSAQSDEHPYTIITLARFLGFTRTEGAFADRNVTVALDFLELKELKIGNIRTIDDLRATPGTGPIPVFSALKIIRELKEKHNVTMERAKERAKQNVVDGEAIKRKLSALQAEQKKAEAESERLLKEKTDAERDNAVKRAREVKQELAQKAKDTVERDIRVKAAKAEYKQLQKVREKEQKETDALTKRQAVAAQAQWDSRSKNLRDRIDRTLSINDPLYDEMLTWVRDKRVTEQQRSFLQLALRNLSERAANFNPNPARPVQVKGTR